MAKNICLTRIENLLSKSSIKGTKQEEIVGFIKDAMAEKKLSSLDEINVDKISKEVSEQIKLQKKINKRNALENEIKVRKYTEYVLREFPDDPQEGLISIMVGSNARVAASRASVSVQQNATVNQLIAGFNTKLRLAKVDQFFDKGLEGIDEIETQRRTVNTIAELSAQKTAIEENAGLKPPITETNPTIIKIAEIMEEYSEMVRQKLNDRGANIPRIWGYIVKQSHDPYTVRDAAKVLGLKLNEIEVDANLTVKQDINYARNYKAWKDFVSQKLDADRTFANTDNVDEFLQQVYSTLVGNKYQLSEGIASAYGSRAKDVAKGSAPKRILHFKSSNDWFDYNQKFGAGNLKESFFSGLQTAGRNIGMLDTLGTKPKENFLRILETVHKRQTDSGKESTTTKVYRPFDKYMKIIDGSIYTVEGFGLAKYSAIARSIQSMAKLGGATISAMADVGIYGSELNYQGRSYLGGMFEALGSLFKIKNTKQKKEIAEMLGFISDNTIYDMSARNQVGDNLSKGWTRTQRTFFKYNLLSWWTNTLKEGSMLGLANYFAKQKNLEFGKLNFKLQNLFKLYDVDATKWDIIRKTAMEQADDGKEFINIGLLDQMSDADVKKIRGTDNLTQRQIRIEKEKFKTSVSGILLDRSIYAVIEPDARVKGFMTQGALAGTGPGEAIRFFGQFKAFPISIVMKVLGRDMDYFKGRNVGDTGRGIRGLSALIVTSGLLGYLSMTIKDFLRGKGRRDPTKFKTIMAAFLQGGGLGIYGDVLFKETRDAGSVLAGLAGPIPLTVVDVGLAFKYALTGEGGKTAKAAHRAVSSSIPFLNLFYVKQAFDYMIGYQIMETVNPGGLRRVEQRMKREYNQEFLFTKPSTQFKGF